LNKTQPTICAIYARVSDESQVKGDSIEHQISFCREYARRRGLEEGLDWATPEEWVYVDAGISGTSLLGRRAVQQLIADAKHSEFTVILFKGISRFARDTIDALLLLRTLVASKVRIISMEENFDSQRDGAEFVFTIHSALAQAESEKTAIRVRMGAAEKARSGKWNGQPPMGYHLDVGSQKLTIDEETAPIIRQVFAWYKSGLGCRVIADRLNQSGQYTRSGRLWSQRQILRVLKNPAYVGDVVYGRVEQKGVVPHQGSLFTRKKRSVPVDERDRVVVVRDAHKALVDRVLFETVQTEITNRSNVPGRVGYDHLLTKGLLKCRCGSSMTIKYNGHGSAYYRCIRQMNQGRSTCGARYLRADDVEQAVLLHVRAELWRVFEWQSGCDPADVRRMLAQSAEVDRRIERELEKSRILFDQYMDGTISEEQYRRINEWIRQRLKWLKISAQTVLPGNQVMDVSEPTLRACLLRQLEWPTPNPTMAKRLVKRMIESIRVIHEGDDETGLRIQYRFPQSPGQASV
jgi:site-specific DNA recombinase